MLYIFSDPIDIFFYVVQICSDLIDIQASMSYKYARIRLIYASMSYKYARIRLIQDSMSYKYYRIRELINEVILSNKHVLATLIEYLLLLLAFLVWPMLVQYIFILLADPIQNVCIAYNNGQYNYTVLVYRKAQKHILLFQSDKVIKMMISLLLEHYTSKYCNLMSPDMLV